MITVGLALPLALTAAQLAGPVSGNDAQSSEHHTRVLAQDHAVDVYDQLQRERREATPNDGRGARQAVSTAPVTVVRFVVACTRNRPDRGANVDALCRPALAGCLDTPTPDDVLYWRFVRQEAADPAAPRQLWQLTGAVCLRPADVPAAARPAFTLADFRRLRLQSGVVTLQPSGRPVLVGVPLNLVTEPRPQTFRVRLLGQPLEVRATPVRYVWDLGTGDTLATTAPGTPYPVMTTTHTYTAAGRVAVTLTTQYRGEYRLAGTATWLPVDGTAQVTAAPVPVDVVEARAVLVTGADS